MTTPRRRRTAFHDGRVDLHGEDGIALVLVLGAAAVMMTLVISALAFTQNSTRMANVEQQDLGAISAAQAGLDDYLFRLNADDDYILHDDANPDPDNAAFTSWVSISDTTDAAYTYDVDISQLGQTGLITIVSSGRVGDEVRSVRATLRRQSFLEFLYLTDLETLDPAAYAPLTVDPPGPGCCLYGNNAIAWAEANCTTRRWITERPNGSNQCREIFWANSDRVEGPFHTNDRFRVSGNPTWTETTTSSANDGCFYTDGGSNCGAGGSPNFDGGPPEFRPALELPPNNTEIRVEADYSVGGDGCLFTGPTRIVLDDNQLVVTSPFTRTTGIGCGTYSLGDPTERISLPSNGVVYVQDVPTTGDNAWGGCPSGGHPFGLPWYDPANGQRDDRAYSCRAGDVFLNGRLDGRLTIAAENDINVINDVTMRDDPRDGSSDDMLGLVANNFVAVYHPADEGSNRRLRSGPWFPGEYNTNLTVEAAILSVAHSWYVPYWYVGNSMGSLNVFGAISQAFRGPVGTFSGSTQVAGYDKFYDYDERLRFINPPHFINPVAAEWRIRAFSEELGYAVTPTP